MYRIDQRIGGRGVGMLVVIALAMAVPALGEVDRSRYMSPDDLRPGMKGFGRTVMSGTKIDTFNIEIIGVMRNAYYAKQDVILIRCSGLNLEHSGIIGGMSGSPCYIRDESGKERMIGAVAYGWQFNKDPICGVQPITQMLPIPETRDPKKTPAPETQPVAVSGAEAVKKPDPQARGATRGGGVPIGNIIAKVCPEPIDKASRFSIFNEDIAGSHSDAKPESSSEGQLRPLMTPVMVTGASQRTMGRLKDRLERFGMEPVVSGAPSAAVQAGADNVKMQPGSVLCIPLMDGDIIMQALGTCTEVDGDRVLGFGHLLLGEGNIELPFATGFVHTVIPSVMRSNKIGAGLKPVGTLWGDENTGIFGMQGKPPPFVPLEVTVHDVYGDRSYHYEIVQEQMLTPALLMQGVMESIFAHNDLPREHTIRYAIETQFEKLGAFRTSNLTSQSGIMGVASDTSIPVAGLMNAPFGKARLERARLEITIEKGAKTGLIDEVTIPRTLYKPGETVSAHVRWLHELHHPLYTRAIYDLKLPGDLPDGDYDLTVGSVMTHIVALRMEKPHLFDADTPEELLSTFNLLGSFPDNRLYMRLRLQTGGGLAVDSVEMPDLPSYRRQILLASKRSDIEKFTEALVVQHETEFAVSGSHSFKITVSRRADQ